LGATYRETRIEVGARFSRSAPSVVAIMEKGGDTGSGQSRRLRVAKTIPARTLLADGGEGLSVGPTERDQILRALETSGSRSPGGQVAEGHQAAPWPVDYPPAPQWSSELWLERIVFCDTEPFAGLPLISPDGVATGEVCTSSEGALGRGWAGNDSGDPSAIPMAIASRLHHAVAGLVITGLAPGGRLEIDWCPPPPIWLTGRAAGAGSYLESLRSGVEVGAAVAAELTGRKVTTRGEVQGSARRSCVTDARPDSARVAGERGSVAAEDESGVGRERG